MDVNSCIADVGKSAYRFRILQDYMPTATIRSKMYSYDQSKVLDGSQLLLLSGMPVHKLKLQRVKSFGVFQRLSGNMMSVPVVGAIFRSLFSLPISLLITCWS